MGVVNRRDFLLGSAAAAVAVQLPIPAGAGAVAPVAKPLPVWSVGTPGDYNYELIRAATKEAAEAEWYEVKGYDEEEREHYWCEADRAPHALDEYTGDLDSLEAAEMAGWGYVCGRCGYEQGPCDWHAIKDQAVCYECLSLSEWKQVDPDRYAEMLDELLFDEYGI